MTDREKWFKSAMSKADVAFHEAVKRDVAEMIERGDKILTLASYVRGVMRPSVPTEIAGVGVAAVVEALIEASAKAVR